MSVQITPEEYKEKLELYMGAFSSSNFLYNDEEDTVSVNCNVLVPEGIVSVLIGKGGANVNETKAACGVNISFFNKNESVHGLRKCFYTGTVAGVTKAIFALASFLSETPHASNGFGIVVKNSAAGAIIGKAGATLAAIREQTGCNLSIEKSTEALPQLGGRVLSMRHPESSPASLTLATYLTIRTKNFASPTASESRAAASSATDMFSSFNYGPAAVAGMSKRFAPYGSPPSRSQGGMSSIASEEFKMKLALYLGAFATYSFLMNDEEDNMLQNCCILIPEGGVPLLIGKHGANVNETKMACGVDISFSKKEESIHGLRKCFHSGSVAGITKAIYVLTSFLSPTEHATNGIGIVVKSDAAGSVIGKAGATLKTIRERTGCNVSMEKSEESSPQIGGRVLSIRHPDSSPESLTLAAYMALRTRGYASMSHSEARAAAAAAPASAIGFSSVDSTFDTSSTFGYGTEA